MLRRLRNAMLGPSSLLATSRLATNLPEHRESPSFQLHEGIAPHLLGASLGIDGNRLLLTRKLLNFSTAGAVLPGQYLRRALF